MTGPPPVQVQFTADDKVSPVAEKVRAGIRGLGEASSESTEGLLKVRRALGEVVTEALGLTGQTARLAEGLGEFFTGGAVVAGVGAGIAALMALWHALTEEQEKARTAALEAAQAVEGALRTSTGALLEQADKLQKGLEAGPGFWSTIWQTFLAQLKYGGDWFSMYQAQLANQSARLQTDLARDEAALAKEREQRQAQETQKEIELYQLRARNGQLSLADAQGLAAIEAVINQLLQTGNLTAQQRVEREKELQQIARIREEAAKKEDEILTARLTVIGEEIKQHGATTDLQDYLQGQLDAINKRMEAQVGNALELNRLEAIRNRILEDRQLITNRNLGVGSAGGQIVEGLPGQYNPAQEGYGGAQYGMGDLLAGAGARAPHRGRPEPSPLTPFQGALRDTIADMGQVGQMLDKLNSKFAETASGGIKAATDGVVVFGQSLLASGGSMDVALKSVGKFVGGLAKHYGEYYTLEGIAKLAQSIFPPNPAGITAALKEIAAGGALLAFAGAEGGGGSASSGGGGSLAPSTATQNLTNAGQQGTVTVVIPKNQIYLSSDPSFQRLIAETVAAAAGRRVVTTYGA
jgi:hypothetical protein